MKILHISALPVWSLEGKGGMPSLRETLKGHVRSKHTIQLILPRYDLFSDDFVELSNKYDEGYEIHFTECRWLLPLKRFRNFIARRSGRASIPYPFRWLINMTMLFCLTISLCLKASELSRKGFKPDLIYAHNQYAALTGFILGLFEKRPNVTRLYGTFLADLMKKPFVVFRYPTAAAGYIVPSTLLICANDGTRGDEVARKFRISKKRFRFWQNGIDPPSERADTSREEFVKRYAPKLKKDTQWIISCSRLSSWKRIDRMLHALKICKDSGGDCQLLMAGAGPDRNKLEALTMELGISNNVIWMGAVAHDDIWAMMNVADVFMITNDVTNRCNPLFEAIWAGLPVVSVSDLSTADLLKDSVNAMLAEKDDTKSLGKKLAQLCGNKDLRNKFKIAQKQISKSFWTWEERMDVEVKELEKLV
jgi:glycosyltransferase involved in cell wall biosynthesis